MSIKLRSIPPANRQQRRASSSNREHSSNGVGSINSDADFGGTWQQRMKTVKQAPKRKGIPKDVLENIIATGKEKIKELESTINTLCSDYEEYDQLLAMLDNVSNVVGNAIRELYLR